MAKLSPSISELTIKRHMKDDGDAILVGLFDSVAAAREACSKAANMSEKVLQNTLETPAMRHKKARDAGFELLQKATSALDQAVRDAESEVAALRGIVKGPKGPKDVVQQAMQRELRERLMQFTPERRREIIDAAVAEKDDELISAVLSVRSWVSGMSQTEIEMIRHGWASKNCPSDVDRLSRITSAIDDAKRAGQLSISFIDGLTDEKLIRSAEQTEKAAADALKEVSG